MAEGQGVPSLRASQVSLSLYLSLPTSLSTSLSTSLELWVRDVYVQTALKTAIFILCVAT